MTDAPAAPVVVTGADVALLLGHHPNIIGHRQRMADRIDTLEAAYAGNEAMMIWLGKQLG